MTIYESELKDRRYSDYKERIYSEKELLEIAKETLKKCDDIRGFVKNLLTDLSRERPHNKNFDWNIGSTIQHFNPNDVLAAFKEIDHAYLTDSIGLSWVLGEFKLKDQEVIDFLYDVILNGQDSEAWWRAAFSLEKIGIEDAVVLLKRGLKSKGLKNLDHYLENLSDKRSIIGVLLRSSNFTLRSKIYPKLKKTFIESEHAPTLINCSWLLGRFKLIDEDILKKLVYIINTNQDYELVYYTYFAIQELANPALSEIFEKFCEKEDALLIAKAGTPTFSPASLPAACGRVHSTIRRRTQDRDTHFPSSPHRIANRPPESNLSTQAHLPNRNTRPRSILSGGPSLHHR